MDFHVEPHTRTGQCRDDALIPASDMKSKLCNELALLEELEGGNAVCSLETASHQRRETSEARDMPEQAQGLYHL